MQDKLNRMIGSCENIAQLEVAKKYLTLAYNSCAIDEQDFNYYTGLCAGLQLGHAKFDVVEKEYLSSLVLSDPEEDFSEA